MLNNMLELRASYIDCVTKILQFVKVKQITYLMSAKPFCLFAEKIVTEDCCIVTKC